MGDGLQVPGQLCLDGGWRSELGVVAIVGEEKWHFEVLEVAKRCLLLNVLKLVGSFDARKSLIPPPNNQNITRRNKKNCEGGGEQ